jgi:hypothetical protein
LTRQSRVFPGLNEAFSPGAALGAAPVEAPGPNYVIDESEGYKRDRYYTSAIRQNRRHRGLMGKRRLLKGQDCQVSAQ